MSPSARNNGAFSASASAEPSTPAIAASTIPQMAPPAMRPLANNTPGPDSSSAIDCCRACARSEEHTSELQSRLHLVCRLLLEKKKQQATTPANAQTPQHRSNHT